MNDTKTLRGGLKAGELAALLAQMGEEKSRMERLLSRVEQVLRHAAIPAQTNRAARISPARPSPLDRLNAVASVTGDLRESNGNLSAARVAKVFGVRLSHLARWLGKTKQAVNKTPDADSLQAALGYFERVARLRLILKSDAGFRKWLRTPQAILENASPLQVLAKGEWQAMADFVDDALTGAPT